MKSQATLFVALFLVAFTYAKVAVNDDDFGVISGFGNFTTVVEALNYPVETHLITTEDGYILTFFRIQAKYRTSFASGLPVAYLQHGFIDSGDTWVINDESDAPGLQLANNGYDVWIGNSRGNKYCMSHVTLNSNEAAFWQFSWQNMSQYDLPAAFEYINQQTGQMINYVGHSQGTTIMLAALSKQDPTILQYLNKFVALSPVAWVAHTTSGPMSLLADSPLSSFLVDIGANQFFPPDFLETDVGHLFCDTFSHLCVDFLQFACGADPNYDNYAQFGTIMEHVPGGTSVMDALHWKQDVLSGNFSEYDYGSSDADMAAYGQPFPPSYDIGNLPTDIPIHLFFAGDDSIVDPRDTQTLLNNLPSGATNIVSKTYPGTGHMTWLWGKGIDFYFSDLLNILAN